MASTSDITNRERKIFQESPDLPEAGRAGHVRQACGDDAELEERILRLLAAHRRAESRTGGLMDERRVEMEDPERIGPFRILERLGEGGMGVVYAAEQTEPVERKVALKVIKLGMDTREVIARFASERQALALMSHPNIARMLDAGATDQGRPYFVMEYVSGVPITEYCDSRQLGVEERLGLFLGVCAGVQHAHQKGVIHRDLEPSNILVEEEDGRPRPKIIDFGVAKAMNRRLTDLTMQHPARPHHRNARVHEPRAGRDVAPRRRYPLRHLLPRPVAVRAADRQPPVRVPAVAGATQRDIYTLDPGSGQPAPFVVTPANEPAPAFAPGGDWIAYVSNETGRNEVYVRAWPPPGPVHVVSIDGGTEPVWSRDGRRLYYRRENRIMEVAVETADGFSAGQPVPLPFQTDMVDGSGGNPSYDVEPGERRFLMLRSPREGTEEVLRVVFDWDRELREQLGETR